MELVYRIRAERVDRHGRATVTADVHWGGQRLQLSTGVKVQPAHWQPTKKQQVNTKEADANGKNLRLAGFAQKINKVFTLADGQEGAEESVTADELRTAVSLAPTPAAEVPTAPPASAELTMATLHQRWKEENAGLNRNSLRRYDQVLGHLGRFRSTLQLGQITRKVLADYQVFTQKAGISDASFTTHVKWLREAFRTAGLNPPRWLTHKAPDSRPISLTHDEFMRLVQHEFRPSQRHLADERDVFVLQTLLLLRDSDIRRLRPGYLRELTLLVGQPPVLVAGLPQQKTKEELLLPLPPLAESIWRRCGGKLPIVAQQNRNSRMKDMAAAVGLEREIVKVRWVGQQMQETPLPLSQALTSHAARHTGADLVLAGSGDRTLVEIALGHVNYVYGHDSIYRYGPQLLQAWARALGPLATVGTGENCQRLGETSPTESTKKDESGASFAA